MLENFALIHFYEFVVLTKLAEFKRLKIFTLQPRYSGLAKVHALNSSV